jgi:hypothetical protein
MECLMLKWMFNESGREMSDPVISQLSNMTAEMQQNCERLFRDEYEIGMYFGLLKVQIPFPDWLEF